VEDEETLTQLGAIGCDLAQGYHICRPKPVVELIEWLVDTNWGIGQPPLIIPAVR
jgi:EAL domain-containing protein (putative c-di-GMP-specific phosphodiesterase class I)